MIKFPVVRVVDHVVPGAQDSGQYVKIFLFVVHTSRKIKLIIKFHVVDVVHVVPGAQDSGLLGAAGNLLGGASQGENHKPPSFDQKQTHKCSI